MQGVPEDPGINQRALRLLFSEVSEKKPHWDYKITVSMVEIYNETLRWEKQTQVELHGDSRRERWWWWWWWSDALQELFQCDVLITAAYSALFYIIVPMSHWSVCPATDSTGQQLCKNRLDLKSLRPSARHKQITRHSVHSPCPSLFLSCLLPCCVTQTDVHRFWFSLPA